jgi:zinc protease
MPRRLGFLCRTLCLALACSSLGPGSLAGAQTDPQMFNFATLTNGMRVVVVEDHAVPVVSTAMWYRFGASDERPGKTGLAHALAHMMYEGTPDVSAAGLDDAISQLGAKANATTSNDYTVYRFVLPADKLELALRVEADRMSHLLITDAAWSHVKSALLAEYDDDLTRPLTRLYHDVCRAAANVPVCALSPLGDRADVARAVAGDVRSYYQDWYAPNNATLVISGDVATGAVMNLVRSVFEPIPRGDLPDRANVVPFYSADKPVEVAGDFPYEVVDLAFPAPGPNDFDSSAYQIIDAIVNNQRSNFYKALVSSGYTVGYSTQLDQNLRGGLYHVFLVTAPGHTSAQARSAFNDVMKTAFDQGFPEELIRAAKIAISLRKTYARDSVSGLGERVGYAAGVEGASSLERDEGRVAATTSSDVTTAARKFFQTPAVLGLLTPAKSRLAASNAGPPVTTVTDDFTRRAPIGKVVEARFVRDPLLAPVDIATRLHPTRFIFSNGLHLLVQEEHANPTVFITGAAQTSPRSDPPGKEGTGAMFSSLLDDGSSKIGADQRRRTLDALGATLNLGLTFDAHGPAQATNKLIELIADTLRHPALRGSDVEEIRKQTLGAVEQSDEDPDFHADADFDQLLMRPGDPSLREPTADSVGRIKIADLRDYARHFVRPDLTVITVVGDVDPREVEREVAAAFGDWKNEGSRPDLDPGPYPPAHAAIRYVVTNHRLADAHLGTPAVAVGSDDYYALAVLNEILGADGGFDTRLAASLRTREDLAYRVASYLTADRYRGTLDFRLTAQPSTVPRAVAALRGELARLHDDPVGPFELDRARTKIVAGGFVSEEATQVVAERVQANELEGLPLNYERTLPSRYGALDGAALQRAAQTYLRPESLVEVYEGPQP